jgi:hypothetical protein
VSDLHQAVQAEIAAHIPTLPPSFEALKARKRARDRRRTGAVAAVSALAVAGIAFVPSAFLGGGGKAPAQVAQPGDAETFGFHIKATDTWTDSEGDGVGPAALQLCLELPGLSEATARYSYPGQYTGRVTGRGNADALKACVEAVPGWGVTLTPVTTAGEARAYTVWPAVKTVANPRLEEQRDACFALPGVQAVGQGESMPVIYRITVAASDAPAFEQCIGSVVGLYIPELDEDRAGAGEPAVWDIDAARPPRADDRVLTAQVTRLACASGETGEVLAPSVVESAEQVVITFTVAPRPPGTSFCSTNKPVAYEVTLAAPLGQRVLIDGTCDSPPAKATSLCLSPQRWPAPE